ncbi:heme biosynthesis HemY N-terminal domain-containing protein [Roseomonas sp. CCTCC AB2023176]|uniref:heme biosynthesis HemY N-terminal domain-containing protein n=1 Tax=Roseomonas sp. CCTCC AB2023176 TaxID=3342640 RepID=UPI0035DD223F
MWRAIWLLVLLVLGVAAALYFRNLGGSIEMQVGAVYVAVPLWLGLVGLVVLFAVIHYALVFWRWLRGMPARTRARRDIRNRERGDAAVTRALIALAAGTADGARQEIRRARNLLGDTPQTLLLTAEAERMAGRDEAANEAFKALARRDDSKFLGLRGLLRDAMARQDWPAAQRLAKEAEAAQPGATWLREERAALALRTRDWREALTLSPPGAGNRAALALAAAGQEGDAAKAAVLERQALEADPGFTPAAIAQYRRLMADGSPRRAKQVLANAWTSSPHPDLAEEAIRGETDPLARVKAAEALTTGNRTHPEARLLLAQTAMQAGLTGRARAELDALLASGAADRRAYLAMVDLEAMEQGTSAAGRAAEAKWLRAAAAAAPEPRWRCNACATDHAAWAPVCDHCNSVGRIAWTGNAAPAAVPAVATKA